MDLSEQAAGIHRRYNQRGQLVVQNRISEYLESAHAVLWEEGL